MIFLVSLIISLLSLFYVHFSVFHIFRFPLFHCFVPQPFLSSALSLSLCVYRCLSVSLCLSLCLFPTISPFPVGRSLSPLSRLSVFMGACMYACVYECTYVSLHMCVCMRLYTYTYLCIYMYLMYYARVYVGICIFVCVYASIALFLSFHSNGLAHCHYSAVPFLRFSRCAMYEDNLLKSSRRRRR